MALKISLLPQIPFEPPAWSLPIGIGIKSVGRPYNLKIRVTVGIPCSWLRVSTWSAPHEFADGWRADDGRLLCYVSGENRVTPWGFYDGVESRHR